MKDNRLVEMRVFKAVAESGGFTAAAHVLGSSQPFVSQKINELEERLGVKLLRRSTRVQKLTAEGEQFLASCNAILEGIDTAEAQVKTSEPSGVLRVSAPLAFGADQLVPRLPQFLERYPGIKFQLSLSDSLVNLIEDNIDVAIRMGRLQDSALASRRLCELQRIVIAAPGYIEKHGRPVTPHGLSKHRCLTWHGPQSHLNRWPFLINGKYEEVLVEGDFASSSGMSLFQMCVDGVGIMRCAEHLALPAVRAGKVAPLLTDYVARDDTAIHAVFLPERRVVHRIRAFVEYCAEIFRVPPWL